LPTSPPISNKIGQRLGARGNRTRERFLEAARNLLATLSPIDLTASAISKGAGSSPATFYVYFDSVHELLLALSATASASVDALFPERDALLVDERLEADIITMIAAVNAAWDCAAPILLFRNLEADRGDVRFDELRTHQAQPILERIAAAIAMRRDVGLDPAIANAEAAVLVAAIERIAVRTHRPSTDGPQPQDLSDAVARLVIKAIRP
jgi:AcrR family transcriptional regulator